MKLYNGSNDLKMRFNLKNSNLIVLLFVAAFVLCIVYYKYKNSASDLNSSSRLESAENENEEITNFDDLNEYSRWPSFLQFTKMNLDELKRLMKEVCVRSYYDGKNATAIEDLDLILKIWQRSKNKECRKYFLMFRKIYEVKFERGNLVMSDQLSDKVKAWLRNDANLLNQAYSQRLITVYNRFTKEENVFNPLRTKRPVKDPEVSPDIFYQKTMNESKQNCDFCATENTASGSNGRLKSAHSYMAANLFPFDSPHEMAIPRKHDLLSITYEEFKDLLDLPTKWFQFTNEKNRTLKYPVLLWDFMLKGGASQIHPHLHVTLNEDRYYSTYEIIRQGAQNYFKSTNRNYFNDFTTLHHLLDLGFVHKEATMIFSITPRKDYDAIIMSETFNDSVIELLFALLRTYMINLKIYPFSLTIYYPSLDKKDVNGQIPIYVKVIPRGDISSLRSDMSTLELMTISNSNMDQFELSRKMQDLIKLKLRGLNV